MERRERDNSWRFELALRQSEWKLGKRLRSYEKENRSLIPAGDKVPILKIRRCSVHLRDSVLPWWGDKPKIFMLLWEWPGWLKCRATGLEMYWFFPKVWVESRCGMFWECWWPNFERLKGVSGWKSIRWLWFWRLFGCRAWGLFRFGHKIWSRQVDGRLLVCKGQYAIRRRRRLCRLVWWSRPYDCEMIWVPPTHRHWDWRIWSFGWN